MPAAIEIADRAIEGVLEAKYRFNSGVKDLYGHLPKRSRRVLGSSAGRFAKAMDFITTPYQKGVDLYFQKFFGITREFPELGPFWGTLFLKYNERDLAKHNTEVVGQLPPEGPAILSGNHTSDRDARMAVKAFRQRGRIVRCIARDTLFDVRLKEDASVLKATGKEDNDLLSKPLTVRWIGSFLMRAAGPIPLRRGGNPLSALRKAITYLDKGQMVGCFLQETRILDGSLANLHPGIGYLSESRPNVKVIPVGVSYLEDKEVFNMGEGFTFNEAKADPVFEIPGLDNRQRMTIYTASRVASLLPERLERRWVEEQRDEAIEKFRRLNEEETDKKRQRIANKTA